MGKNKTKTIQSHTTEEHKSIIFWLIMAFVVLFLLIAPFYRGLFNGGSWIFEGPIYWAVMWSGVVLFFISIYFFKHWQLRNLSDVLSLAVWLIPLSYLISTWNAASYHAAVNGILIHTMCAVFFLIGLYFSSSKLSFSIIQYSIIGSGYFLVIYGFLNWFGNAEYQDAVLGSRLSSVFQYPNTYAAYLIALLIITLLLVNISKKWYAVILYASMLVPILISFLLTFSRGGLVILPVVIIVYLIFLPFYRQILQLIYLCISAGISLMFLQNFLGIRKQVLIETSSLFVSLKGWLLLFAISALVSGLIYSVNILIGVRLERKGDSKNVFAKMNLVIPASSLILGILGAYLLLGTSIITNSLPEALKVRIDGISMDNRSVESRTTFYMDSIKVIQDYPTLGAGGGAWSSLYESYKSYPYTSRQAHNFILQHIIEVGIIGFSIFVIVVSLSLVLFIRRFFQDNNDVKQNYKLLIPLIFPLVLLFHSMIDFDMTFLYLTALVFLCLGVLASCGVRYKIPALENSKANSLRIVIPSIMLIISIIIFLISYQQVRAFSTFKKYTEVAHTSQDYNELANILDQALKMHPTNPNYLLQKIGLLRQVYSQTQNQNFYDDALILIEQMKKKEPFNRQLVNEEYELYITNNQLEHAINLIDLNREKFRFDIDIYEKLFVLYDELSTKYERENNIKKSTEYNRLIFQTYDQFNEEVSKIEQTNSHGNFSITPVIALIVGGTYYENGDYVKAEEIFMLGRISNDFTITENRYIARWLLASVIQQNKEIDMKLYDLLINADSQEKEEINNLLKKTNN
jgi:hypothetical protein